jgi:hypothetical protein
MYDEWDGQWTSHGELEMERRQKRFDKLDAWFARPPALYLAARKKNRDRRLARYLAMQESQRESRQIDRLN